ncbi:SRPBCC domain-containing protein [Sphingomonas sp. LM7]|uniref:SRPBCC domain-containing protein n=1 Tax=Sphingomonas sp. LM7 TaxID=1938607 RepID=UPI0009839416|nr:SRPBCC domain-containing protein [Sphingomonas sp. LM7]AQR75104.1 hypothetical protein BXU08_16840 [Sphingomonas sp. LM7]
MRIIENETAIAAPPAQVWRVLSDFPGYCGWHPFIRLSGEATLGAEVDYEFTAILRSRRVRHSPAVITRLERDTALEWQMGYRHVFQHIESWELSRLPTGTRLRHWVEFRGAFALLMSRAARNAAHSRMCEADDDLRSHVEGKKSRTPAPVRRAPRNGFRKPRR